VAGALVVLATLATLAGCSPAAKPVTALRLVDGHPTLLVAKCDDANIDAVSVFTGDGATITEAWRARDPRLPAETGAPPDEIRLLEAPSGWSVSDDSLTTFAPGVDYTATAYGSPGDAFPIDFTLEKLAALDPGQVLAGESNNEATAMSEKDFRDNAEDACGGGLFGLG
jgi:hypothetical protein